MNARKKRLGRGLDALLSKPVADSAIVSGDEPSTGDETLKHVPLDLLQRGRYQPRLDMRQESLEDLANSIRQQGVLQPIVVRPVGKKGKSTSYEIIAGERIQEFDLTHAEAATAVGRSRAAVSNLLRLQDLADKVKPLVEERKLDMGHARALLGISNSVQQLDAARQVVRKGLSVRETERLVKRMLEPKSPAASKAGSSSANGDIRRLEIDVSEKLGAKVRVQHTAKGSGKLVIEYHSLDELDGILGHIK